MRRMPKEISKDYRIAILDDEMGIVDSVSLLLKRAGYSYKGFNDPFEAIAELRSEHYDMLILDYLMDAMHGDEVVEKLREFDQNIYILLLTGHKDIAPPLETLRKLDIQGYCEKSDNFDQLILLIESGLKSIKQVRKILTISEELNTVNEMLNRTYEELKSRYMDTVEVLRLAVDAKDVYTRGHSDRVSYYAQRIGKAFSLSEQELEMLRLGGVFHDIGKIGTADDILFKTEGLNSNEYNQIKMHPLKGACILSVVSMFKDVVPLVKCHHERIDGKGYPEGLKGDDIPYLARILSIADAFDAMTSDRLYRSKLNLYEAKKQLIDASGTQFDGSIVNKFIELLDSEYENIQEEIKHTF